MNTMVINNLVGSLLIIFFSACYIAEPDGDTFFIETDKTSYVPDEMMTVTFTNRSGYRYLLINSGCDTLGDKPLPDLQYERKVNDEWVDAGGPVCPEVLRPPVELHPSKTYSVTFTAYVSAMEFVPGTYRLRFYFSDEDGTPLPPEDQQVSNEFRIE